MHEDWRYEQFRLCTGRMCAGLQLLKSEETKYYSSLKKQKNRKEVE